MTNLNKAMVIGNLTRDPEIRNTPSGQTVASFAVATNLVWNDASGQRQEKVEFHNIVAWRKLAEICGQYLKKGQRVFIEGRLQTRDWTGQDGVKRYRTEIVAENMIMLSPPSSASSGQYNSAPQSPEKNQANTGPEIPTIDQETPTNFNPSQENPTGASDADEEEDVKVENIPF